MKRFFDLYYKAQKPNLLIQIHNKYNLMYITTISTKLNN
jgi:hypothetical protein